MSVNSHFKTEPAKTYHLTCVVNELLPVFSHPQIVRIIMGSWDSLRQQYGMKLYGYVVMEEHLHFLAQAERLDLCLSGFLEQTAAGILDYLQQQQLERFLKRLQSVRYGSRSTLELWQENPEIELMNESRNVLETLEYIHINPVKRGYVDDPLHWRYSSARNYAGESGSMDIDLWS